jgi:hypothetical protein
MSWGRILRWVAPSVGLTFLFATIYAAEPWLRLVPREFARPLTEGFLRVLLIGYFMVLVVSPLVLAVTLWLVLRDRRQGRRRTLLAKVCLLSASTLVAVPCLEAGSAAWLAWVHRMPWLPTHFEAPSGIEKELNVVVLGGSSALGFPYNPTISVGQIVAWQLQDALPDRSVKLDIRANLGKNLEEMHLELTKLKRHPDLLIVFSGHNEFLSRFHSDAEAGYDEAPDGLLLSRMYNLSLKSPLCLLIYETVRKHRLGSPPPPDENRKLFDKPAFSRSQFVRIIEDFGKRLEAIVGYCEQIGTVPVLIIPASNESGFEPNRTVLPASLGPAERERLAGLFYRARALEADDPEQSIRGYRELVAEEPGFAEAHFRLGRLLEAAERYDEAREEYILARDADGYPVRCREDQSRMYYEVAEGHGCALVDTAKVIRPMTQHGILSDCFFHDAHHPTLLTHVSIAQAVLDQLYQRGEFNLGPVGSRAPRLNLEAVAGHFRVDAKVWTDVCVKSGTYYTNMSTARFDRTERLAKHRWYLQAAHEIRDESWPPERTGVPGLGVSASLEDRRDWWTREPIPESVTAIDLR